MFFFSRKSPTRPLQILTNCYKFYTHVIIYDYVIGIHFSGLSHFSLALQVNCEICNIVRFKMVLTCVLYQICVNIRLLGMRVQNTRLYAFLACIFDENCHTCPTPTRITQSGLTLSWQIQSNKAAVRFLGILDQN